MPFGTSIDDDSTDTENDDTTTVDLREEAPFEPCEVTDTYLSFVEYKMRVSRTVDPEEIDIDTWNNDLSDLRRLLSENEDRTPQERGYIVASMAKSSIGDAQSELADNGAGLDTDGDTTPRVSKPDDDRYYYADIYPELSTIPTVELDDDGGFTQEFGTRVPCTPRGEPLPVEFDSEEDVQEAIDLINRFPDELSYWTAEDGVVEPDRDYDLAGVDTEEPSTESEQDGVSIPVNPADSECYVDDIKEAIEDTDDLTVVQQILAVERSNDDRTTAVRAIEGRIEELQDGGEESDDAADSDDGEAYSEATRKVAETMLEKGFADTEEEALEKAAAL